MGTARSHCSHAPARGSRKPCARAATGSCRPITARRSALEATIHGARSTHFEMPTGACLRNSLNSYVDMRWLTSCYPVRQHVERAPMLRRFQGMRTRGARPGHPHDHRALHVARSGGSSRDESHTRAAHPGDDGGARGARERSEEHTSELQSPCNLVCRLLLEKKKKR